MKLFITVLLLSAACLAQTQGDPSRLGLGFNSTGYSGYKVKNDSSALKLYKRTLGSRPGEVYDSTLIFRAVGGKIYLHRTRMDTTVIIRMEIDSVKRNDSD
jgi:hypothetical protein